MCVFLILQYVLFSGVATELLLHHQAFDLVTSLITGNKMLPMMTFFFFSRLLVFFRSATGKLKRVLCLVSHNAILKAAWIGSTEQMTKTQVEG